jgi:uncharacterized Rmd1/YagE family protein
MKFFNARQSSYHTNAILIDEVIYTPYAYDPPSSSRSKLHSQPSSHTQVGDLLGVPELRPDDDDDEDAPRRRKKKSKFDTTMTEAEIFMFEYGTVVIWGMTEPQEKRFLSSMLAYVYTSLPTYADILGDRKRFEVDKLGR